MLLRDFKIQFEKTLFEQYSKDEISHFFYVLIEELLKENRFILALEPTYSLDQQTLALFKNACLGLQQSKPIQYILGNAYFGDLLLKVSESVLIPRPETLELVHWIIDEAALLNNNLSIIDIGTGSGCIPISLSLALPNASIMAMDISEKALEIATENASFHGQTIAFSQADILTLSSLEGQYDLIVSNPPYVRNSEKGAMDARVLDYEPDLALFVLDEKPLIFYEKIAILAFNALKPGGLLFFEINEYLSLETKTMLLDIGYKRVLIRKDIYGKDRMIKAGL